MKKNLTHMLYHVLVIILSAGIALSLPEIIRYITRKVLLYWSFIENEESFLISAEITAAIILIILVNSTVRHWRNRKLSQTARAAGLVTAAPPTSLLAKMQGRKLKKAQGMGRSIMLISSTGYHTFTDPDADLHGVLKNCRDAKIMLLDPLKDGVTARARSLGDPAITPERFRDQIIRSIDFLKGLKACQKNIRLKLYQDPPLVKLGVLGDYLWLKHYPTGLNVRKMPEYVFKHDQDGSLFNLFYQYFVGRWLDPNVPEYDLDTDELIYRNKTGNEVRREKFNDVVMEF
ncbi:MAG TPA: hypothetical protein VIX18_11835 [Nitrospirota bacterium]